MNWSAPNQAPLAEGCTIKTDGSVALLRRVAEKLSVIGYRRRNDNLEAAEAFAYALDAVEQAIRDAIHEYEAHPQGTESGTPGSGSESR